MTPLMMRFVLRGEVSYFRPQTSSKTGLRSSSSLPESTSRLSQKGGRVNPCKCALSECLKLGVQSSVSLTRPELSGPGDA